MSRLLVHIATGPQNPTRAALGLLIARTAAEAGHEVDLFIGGVGVGILRPESPELGAGIGPGSMKRRRSWVLRPAKGDPDRTVPSHERPARSASACVSDGFRPVGPGNGEPTRVDGPCGGRKLPVLGE